MCRLTLSALRNQPASRDGARQRPAAAIEEEWDRTPRHVVIAGPVGVGKVSGSVQEVRFIDHVLYGRLLPAKCIRGRVAIPELVAREAVLLRVQQPDPAPVQMGVGDRKSTRLNSSYIPLSRMPS